VCGKEELKGILHFASSQGKKKRRKIHPRQLHRWLRSLKRRVKEWKRLTKGKNDRINEERGRLEE